MTVLWLVSIPVTVVGGFVTFVPMIIAIANQRIETVSSRSGVFALGLSVVFFLFDLLVFLHGYGADPHHGNF